MKHLIALSMAVLAGCAATVQEPAQPSIAATEAVLSQAATIPAGASPEQVWEVNSWATTQACDASLDAGAKRNNQLSVAGTAVAFAGPAAAAFGAGPVAGIAAATASGLLGLLQTTGVQYTAADTVLIRNTMSQYRQSVIASPPQTAMQALSDSEQHWYLCSVAGIAEAEELAKITAQPIAVSAGPAANYFLASPTAPAEPGVTIGGKRL